MQILFLIGLFTLGACLGSFLCCQARRLHILEEKITSSSAKPNAGSNSKTNSKLNPKSDSVHLESSKSSKTTNTSLGKWSVCLHCHTRLAWYDNIPIISWLILHGKCRKCGQKIGLAELLSELGVAFALFALGFTVQVSSANLVEWLIFLATSLLTLSLAFLSIYDGLYGKLPTVILIVSIVLGALVLALKEWLILSTDGFSMNTVVIHPITSVLVLGGTYLFLYLISHGKWVGDGDWLICTGIALGLANPWLALVVLFLANALACVVMYPIIRKHKSRRIHFGPFLAVAFVIAVTFARPLLALSLF